MLEVRPQRRLRHRWPARLREVRSAQAMEFTADGIDVLNRHNIFVNTPTLQYVGATTTPLHVQELKGGSGTLRTSGNYDELRFGQLR
jgi:hypothetical protein